MGRQMQLRDSSCGRDSREDSLHAPLAFARHEPKKGKGAGVVLSSGFPHLMLCLGVCGWNAI